MSIAMYCSWLAIAGSPSRVPRRALCWHPAVAWSRVPWYFVPEDCACRVIELAIPPSLLGVCVSASQGSQVGDSQVHPKQLGVQGKDRQPGCEVIGEGRGPLTHKRSCGRQTLFGEVAGRTAGDCFRSKPLWTDRSRPTTPLLSNGFRGMFILTLEAWPGSAPLPAGRLCPIEANARGNRRWAHDGAWREEWDNGRAGRLRIKSDSTAKRAVDLTKGAIKKWWCSLLEATDGIRH